MPEPLAPSPPLPAAHRHDVPAIPDTARGPFVPDRGYLVDEVAGGVHWITDGGYQNGFVVCESSVIAIDAPPSIGGESVMRAIRDVTDKPISHVVYSHYHGDHIGHADVYPSDAIRVGHQDTADLLRRFADRRRPPNEVTFDERYRLEVGGKVLDLIYRGPNHAPGNIFVHAPEQRVLMCVDLFYPGWVPFANIAMSKDIPGFVAHHDYALELDFEHLIPGHLTRLGTREDIEIGREYILDVRRAAQNALERCQVTNAQAAAEVGTENVYVYFKLLYDKAVGAAAGPLIEKWTGRLGGVETFAVNHVFIMFQSIRLDDNAEPAVVFFPAEGPRPTAIRPDGEREDPATPLPRRARLT
jgi:glyoxylase-like metal-dependent hydrolase (beta-lactamase superfamily II)